MNYPRIHKTSLWALLALLALAACSGYPGSALPADREGALGEDTSSPIIQQDASAPERTQTRDADRDQGQLLLEQDMPPTPAFDVLTLELETAPPLVIERRETENCPALESTLQQIVHAANPLELAESLQITIQEDKIQVLLILDGTDTRFLQDFGAEVGAQSGKQVQAFVPIATLCDLANTRQVGAIHLPDRAVTQ
jgi:hypothetical protein